jgi:PucR family transcriptional regulator, purine catabolism regulatory protein
MAVGVSISVRELVDQPHLRLEVLAGARGLDRAVTWAHSSDLPEPWDWLAGGELLMRNGRTLPRSAAGQVALVDGLAAAGASALVIGTDPDTPKIAARTIQRAESLDLPLVRTPYSVSFIVVSRAVADATTHEESARLARAGRIYAAIHLAVAGGASSAFVGRLERELGCHLYVLDSATGQPVLDGTRVPSVRLRDAVLSALARRGGAVPGLLHLDGGAVVVEVPYEEPTLLVAERSGAEAFDLALLQHAATATAVEVAHASLRQDHQRQLGASLLAQLLDGRLDATAATDQLAVHGLIPHQARLLAASGADEESQRRLHIGLRRLGVNHLVLRRGAVLFVLAGSDPSAVTAVRDRLPGSRGGVSNVLGTGARGPDAAREAMWALGVAAERDGGLAYYGESSPLPVLRDPAEAQALVDRTLGALLDYDRANGSQLLRSLAVFLGCRRSWQAAARALNVHRQTVVYRMDRVAELTGRTLTETPDIAELWLALSAHELLTGEPVLDRQGERASAR